MAAPLRARFALLFLKTLKKMNNHDSSSHRIKLAAYSSMARAVGSNRLWSRAFLIKHRLATIASRRRRLIPCSSRIYVKKIYKTAKTKKIMKKKAPISSSSSENNNSMSSRSDELRRQYHHLNSSENNNPMSSRSDELRRLVPGGKAMDICCLIEETANYIHCLATQVKVMQSIVDHYI